MVEGGGGDVNRGGVHEEEGDVQPLGTDKRQQHVSIVASSFNTGSTPMILFFCFFVDHGRDLHRGDEDEGELNDVGVGHRVEASQ